MGFKINVENRHRIDIAHHLGQPDRVPIDLSLGDQFNYLHGWLGLDGRRFFLDPGYTFEAQMRFMERFGIEGALGPKYGVAVEPSYFGAEIIFTRDTSPWVRPCLDSLEIHRCADPIIFEWWDQQELWLGQRDNNILRWSSPKDRFCIGDASNVSFSPEHEYSTFAEALRGLVNIYDLPENT